MKEGNFFIGTLFSGYSRAPALKNRFLETFPVCYVFEETVC